MLLFDILEYKERLNKTKQAMAKKDWMFSL